MATESEKLMNEDLLDILEDKGYTFDSIQEKLNNTGKTLLDVCKNDEEFNPDSIKIVNDDDKYYKAILYKYYNNKNNSENIFLIENVNAIDLLEDSFYILNGNLSSEPSNTQIILTTDSTTDSTIVSYLDLGSSDSDNPTGLSKLEIQLFNKNYYNTSTKSRLKAIMNQRNYILNTINDYATYDKENLKSVIEIIKYFLGGYYNEVKDENLYVKFNKLIDYYKKIRPIEISYDINVNNDDKDTKSKTIPERLQQLCVVMDLPTETTLEDIISKYSSKYVSDIEIDSKKFYIQDSTALNRLKDYVDKRLNDYLNNTLYTEDVQKIKDLKENVSRLIQEIYNSNIINSNNSLIRELKSKITHLELIIQNLKYPSYKTPVENNTYLCHNNGIFEFKEFVPDQKVEILPDEPKAVSSKVIYEHTKNFHRNGDCVGFGETTLQQKRKIVWDSDYFSKFYNSDNITFSSGSYIGDFFIKKGTIEIVKTTDENTNISTFKLKTSSNSNVNLCIPVVKASNGQNNKPTILIKTIDGSSSSDVDSIERININKTYFILKLSKGTTIEKIEYSYVDDYGAKFNGDKNEFSSDTFFLKDIMLSNNVSSSNDGIEYSWNKLKLCNKDELVDYFFK